MIAKIRTMTAAAAVVTLAGCADHTRAVLTDFKLGPGNRFEYRASAGSNTLNDSEAEVDRMRWLGELMALNGCTKWSVEGRDQTILRESIPGRVGGRVDYYGVCLDKRGAGNEGR